MHVPGLFTSIPPHICLLCAGNSHQVKARSGRAAVATRLRKFAADTAGGIFADVVVGDTILVDSVVPRVEMVIEPTTAYGWFAELDAVEFHLFDFDWLEFQAAEFEIADFRDRSFRQRVFRE
jgi:hypothetical protein